MNLIDQNKALLSLGNSLENHSCLIDGRTEKDDLSFLVDFASLINFYDQTNTINGDWSPFLLKDPVFLLASIAKTPFNKMHALYVQTCLKLKEVLTSNKVEDLKDVITNSINQLFDQIIGIFHILQGWVKYMTQSSIEYNLKTYILKEIKEKHSRFLWAILWLREELHIKSIDGIEGIKSINKYIYKSYDARVWKELDGKIPYLKLLELKNPIEENKVEDFFNSLKYTGDLLFSFFNSIVEYASVDFKAFQNREDIYPDTLLLKTFTKLMKVYKQQLNGLSKKHLNFYYKDILLQKKKLAVVDKVYISTELSELTSVFELPIATLFNGGEYEDKSPILYETKEKVSLNPARISNTYTLSQREEKKGLITYYKKEEKDVNTLQEDEEGKVKQWKTFGNQNSKEGKKIKLGFAFASPMLLLKEGVRKLTIIFTFSETADLNFFKKGSYYLSTATEWFLIPNDNTILNITEQSNKIKLVINLDISAPAIVSFLENIDGIESSWPIFKMSFTELLKNPPVIKSLKIAVDVKELQSFQLYNDFGLLETEKPFQPLGPTPEKDQGFIIGNAEVFSKPVRLFSIKMDWNNLPNNFISYYYQYNKYKDNCYRNPPIKEVTSILKSIWKKIHGLFSNEEKNIDSPKNIIPTEPFNDMAFKVDFQLLQDKLWKPLDMNMLFGLQYVFFEYKVLKETFSNNLFQGVPEIVAIEQLQVSDIILIKNVFEINRFLKIEDQLNVFIDLKIGDVLEMKDHLQIDSLLKIESRAQISDIIKIKDVDFLYINENESTIKFVDVFEVNQHLKVSELFLIANELKIKSFLEIENFFKKEHKIFYKENSLKTDLKLSDELQLNTSLKVCDLLSFNEDLLLEEAFSKTIGDLIKVKKEIKIGDLFKWNYTQKNENINIDLKGALSYENELDEVVKIPLSGTISLLNDLELTAILNIDYSRYFFEIITINTSRKEFLSTTYKKMFNYSFFGSSEILRLQNDIDPNIQNVPLELTQETSSGFIRMQLKNPKEGFGTLLYPKVVGAIAMYNAELLALNIKKGIDIYPLEEPANEPFTPIVGFFKGNYRSSCTYEYNSDTDGFKSVMYPNYPIECFYYNAFKNYKVYDSNLTTKENLKIKNNFPSITPKYDGKGQLILGLEEVIAPAEISFYFELAQDYKTVKKEVSSIVYEYLGKTGWENLTVISDTTNEFSCSGIITFNFPSDITNVHWTMPNYKYWIKIYVKNNPDWYAPTTFLNTNGIKLQRIKKGFETSPKIPFIEANVIESTYEAIPEIGTIMQPFVSFGGRAAETEEKMNKRVSVRLKTKDRVVTSQDYYRVIKEAYTEIYYIKVCFNKKTKSTEVYLAQAIKSWKDSNAFLPIVSSCLQQNVTSFLKPIASHFANIKVNNFHFTYIKLIGEITIKTGNKPSGVAKLVNNGINIFLSPWISTNQSQIVIDNGVSIAQISEFIMSTYNCIDSIINLAIKLGKKEATTGRIVYEKELHKNITPASLQAFALLVPSLNNHKIDYK
ncbi:hypothetical protein DS884_16085 [Tenacibaculum sp. E3R01]|uniref:hypothetical protein n=1 Tax=Tenacibaculum sp. E3R01 TaxID=2267227 RepID=UPI000DEA64D9|nr:hypothetical protein [Tenacibaculum sp. E3R01]RBW55867.1 hypothetical protein DS884_16085 [Tenacibaculum sp. E3R01]